jgi:hypothetical protein
MFALMALFVQHTLHGSGSAYGTLMSLGAVSGIVVSGALGEVIGIVPVIAAQGAGYILAGMLLTLRVPCGTCRIALDRINCDRRSI